MRILNIAGQVNPPGTFMFIQNPFLSIYAHKVLGLIDPTFVCILSVRRFRQTGLPTYPDGRPACATADRFIFRIDNPAEYMSKKFSRCRY